MRRQRAWLLKGAFFCVAGLPWATCHQAHAQALLPAQGGTTSTVGLGYLPGAYSVGSPLGQSGITLLPIPMPATMGSLKTTAGTANARATDPLGLGYVYGPAAIPMTQGQAGLLMLSTAQRTLGLGTGQLSGVRPPGQQQQQAGTASRGRTAGRAADTRVIAAHTRNSNIPGGQAARYFNRGTTEASGSRSQPYYNRQMQQFPQTGQ
jgi:hypothetical protein